MGIWKNVIYRFGHYLGPLACTAYGVIGSMFGNTSIWTMVVIALDRYNVIVKVGLDITIQLYLISKSILHTICE